MFLLNDSLAWLVFKRIYLNAKVIFFMNYNFAIFILQFLFLKQFRFSIYLSNFGINSLKIIKFQPKIMN